MFKWILVVAISLAATKQVYALDLKLPWPSGETWQVTVGYNGYCTSDGCPDEYHTNANNGYYALDFDDPNAAPGSGRPILAVASGTVVFAGGDPNTGFGYYVKIDHGGGYVSLYGHLKEYPTVSGYVNQGQQIGKLGSTGWSTADHLHFALYYNGECLSTQLHSKPEPFSNYTNIVYGQSLISNNTGLTYSCSYVSKSISPGPYYPGGTVTCQMKFHNTGTATWTKTSGPSYVELASCGAAGQTGLSFFNFDPVASPPNCLPDNVVDWENCIVPAKFAEANVPPGSDATFNFPGKIRSDATPGTQNVYFGPFWNSAIMQGWSSATGYFAVTVTNPVSRYVAFSGKFNGDAYTDVGLWDTVTGTWYIADRNPSSSQFIPRASPVLQNWGGGGYKLIVKDFSGDGYDDLCLYYYSLGRWFIAYNWGTYFAQANGSHTYGAWLDNWAPGDADDWIPFVGNFSVDNYPDIGVFHPYDGRWFVAYNWLSHNPPEFIQQSGPSPNPWWLDNWGTGSYGTYWPFAGTMVGGDSYADVGVFHPGTGRLFVAAYNDNPTRFVSNGQWLDAFPSAGGTSAWRVFCGKSSTDNYDDAIVYLPSLGRWYVAWNWGTYFAKSTGNATDGSWLDGWATEDGNLNWQTMVGDVSGDGWLDLITYTPLYGRWCVAFNQGASSPPRFEVATTQLPGNAWLDSWGELGSGTPKVATEPKHEVLPTDFSLSQNYPNPFNPVTTISYSLPSATHVSLDIFNILGQKVATLIDQDQAAGQHTVTWAADQHASGIYLYRLSTPGTVETKKMLLLK